MFPRCAFHDCEFDHAAALVCPFPSSGTFAVRDNATCRDFMKVRLLPVSTALLQEESLFKGWPLWCNAPGRVP